MKKQKKNPNQIVTIFQLLMCTTVTTMFLIIVKTPVVTMAQNVAMNL